MRARSLVPWLVLLLQGPLDAQAVELSSEVPPLQPHECMAEGALPEVSADRALEAARLATDASHAAILGNHGEARDLLTRSLALDPTAGDVAYLLARTLEELGQIEGAVREYCRFAELAGATPDALEVREHVRRIAPLSRPGIPAEAVEQLHGALQHYQESRLADAERSLSAVVRLAPSWSTPYYNRGIVRVGLSQHDGALADFEQYLELGADAADRLRVERWIDQIRTASGHRYSAGTAFLAGLLPGAGHFYTDRPVVGTLLLAVAGGAVATGVAHTVTHIDCLARPQDGVCPSDQILDQRDERPLLMPALAVAAAASVLGAIDAAIGARRRNAQPPEIRLSDAGSIRLRVLPLALPRENAFDVAFLRLTF